MQLTANKSDSMEPKVFPYNISGGIISFTSPNFWNSSSVDNYGIWSK